MEKLKRATTPKMKQADQVRVFDQLAVEMRMHEEIVAREIFELKRGMQEIFLNDKLIDLAGDNKT